MKKAAGFSPDHRLRKSHEFRAVRQRGRRLHSQHFSFYLEPRVDGPCRLGLTVSKKNGGAVQRNRIKRLVREFFRRNQQYFAAPVDLSVIAKPGAADLTYSEVCEELAPLLLRCGQDES